jgi:hypothetical protein
VARAGQEIEGPDGFRLRLLRTGAETNGEALEMEATYPGSAALPPEHLHPSQVVRWEVRRAAHRGILRAPVRRRPGQHERGASIADFLEEFSDEIRFTA